MNPRLKMRGYSGAALVALAFTVGWLAVQQPILKDQADASNTKADQALTSVAQLKDQVHANAQALADANARLIALGKAPVPVPPAPSPAPLPQGLTAEQLTAVRQVVVDELDSHEARVSQATINQITAAAGKLAQANVQVGIPAAVKAAVAAYCVGDKCVGKTGIIGPKGDPGERGADGKDAPAVTDEQLLAAATQALLAYCGQDSKPCQGPAGKDGTNGVDGKDAPPPYSVTDMDCVGDGLDSFWRTYISNGTDQKVIESKGPCRIGPDPEPN